MPAPANLSHYRTAPRRSPWRNMLAGSRQHPVALLAAGVALLCASPSLAQSQSGSSVAASGTAAQAPTSSSSRPANLPTSSASLVDGTFATYELADLQPVRSTLDIDSPVPAFFHLAAAEASALNEAFVTVSACSIPEVPASSPGGGDDDNVSSKPLSLLRMVVSTDPTQPEPSAGQKGMKTSSSSGGFASQVFNAGDAQEGLWIGIYPPADSQGLSGNVTFEVAASYQTPPAGYSYAGSYDPATANLPPYVLQVDDTDTVAAHLSIWPQSFDPGPAPPAGIIFAPTAQLPSPYLNSSACAIRDMFATFYNSLPADQRNVVQRNVTGMGFANSTEPQRTEFRITGLQPGTNYTAWQTSDTAFPPSSSNYFYGPAVKFVTKTNPNCRLVSGLDFCPDVSYATTIGPDLSTAEAIARVNETLSPVFANFTRTLGTFPCGTPFGQYSYIATCDDCEQAYRRWACSVAFPRCIDTVSNTSMSAASQDGTDLTGALRGPNTDLFPYSVNRPSGENTLNISLGVTQETGELLPCLGVCHMVSIMCPPVIAWTCPRWEITAQRDYGTWADAGRRGSGPNRNGGSGVAGARFGGVQRYVATDAFGHAYCNALGTDLFLRQINAAGAQVRPALVPILSAALLPLLLISLLM